MSAHVVERPSAGAQVPWPAARCGSHNVPPRPAPPPALVRRPARGPCDRPGRLAPRHLPDGELGQAAPPRGRPATDDHRQGLPQGPQQDDGRLQARPPPGDLRPRRAGDDHEARRQGPHDPALDLQRRQRPARRDPLPPPRPRPALRQVLHQDLAVAGGPAARRGHHAVDARTGRPCGLRQGRRPEHRRHRRRRRRAARHARGDPPHGRLLRRQRPRRRVRRLRVRVGPRPQQPRHPVPGQAPLPEPARRLRRERGLRPGRPAAERRVPALAVEGRPPAR